MRIALQTEFRRLVDEPFQHILSESGVRLLTQMDGAKKIDFVAAAVVNEYLLTAILPENVVTEKNAIIQFSNNNLVHYGYLKILYEPSKKPSCVFIDASTPEEHFYGFIRKLRLHFMNVYTVVGCESISKVQLDTKSCPLFSYYHADLFANNTALTNQLVRQCEKIPRGLLETQKLLTEAGLSSEDVNIFERRVTPVQDDVSSHIPGELHVTTWKEIPPEVIRHIQSLSFAAQYIKYQAVKNMEFSDVMSRFLDDQVVTIDIGTEKKERNYGILVFSCEVVQRVMQYIEATKDDELLRALLSEKIIDAQIVNQFFESCETPAAYLEKMTQFFDILRSPKKSRFFTPVSCSPIRTASTRNSQLRNTSATPLRQEESQTPWWEDVADLDLELPDPLIESRLLCTPDARDPFSLDAVFAADCAITAASSTGLVGQGFFNVVKPSPKPSPKKLLETASIVASSPPPHAHF